MPLTTQQPRINIASHRFCKKRLRRRTILSRKFFKNERLKKLAQQGIAPDITTLAGTCLLHRNAVLGSFKSSLLPSVCIVYLFSLIFLSFPKSPISIFK
jgi:hypothetical protein